MTVPRPAVVYVEAGVGAGRFSVDAHLERHGCAFLPDAQDEVDVAGVEAERDRGVGPFDTHRPGLDRPVPRESPLVEPKRFRVGASESQAAPLLGAEVRLRRLQVRPVGLDLEALRESPKRGRRRRLRLPPPAGASESPARTRRSRPRRSGGSGSGPRRPRDRRPASTGCRSRSRLRSRGRARPDTRRASPSPPSGRCRGRARTRTRACGRPRRRGPDRGNARATLAPRPSVRSQLMQV